MKAYAVKNKDISTRMKSRSGGVFPTLSDFILDNNGTVYGCVLDNNLQAVHIRATTKEERDKMCGSKYVQSNKGNIFSQIKSDLKDGKYVLFSGTSCEIDGLRAFIGEALSSKLLLVDIICHGVPSPKIWNSYLSYVADNNGSQVINADFRNKKDFGWAAHKETLYLADSTKYTSSDYASIFYSHMALRPCCSKCPYTSVNRYSDITLADCWGIDKTLPDFSDNKGVSLIIVSTPKGENVLNNILPHIEFIEVDINDFLQRPLLGPAKISQTKRQKFWKNFESKPFSYIVSKYGSNSAEVVIKNLLNKLLPNQALRMLKRFLSR